MFQIKSLSRVSNFFREGFEKICDKVLPGFDAYKESRDINKTIERLTDRITDNKLSNGERLSAFTSLSSAVASHFETESPAKREEIAIGMKGLGKYLEEAMQSHLQSGASRAINIALSEVYWKMGTPDTKMTNPEPNVTPRNTSPSMG